MKNNQKRCQLVREDGFVFARSIYNEHWFLSSCRAEAAVLSPLHAAYLLSKYIPESERSQWHLYEVKEEKHA